MLAVAGWLDGGFDVSNGFDGHAVLVVTVDKLIFKLANFVDEDTKLVSDVADIIVTTFTPD